MQNILSRIFTNKFAIKCSWSGTGRAGVTPHNGVGGPSTSFKIKNLIIIKLIKGKTFYLSACIMIQILFYLFLECVKRDFPCFKEQEIEDAIKDWFRYAGQRLKRTK